MDVSLKGLDFAKFGDSSYISLADKISAIHHVQIGLNSISVDLIEINFSSMESVLILPRFIFLLFHLKDLLEFRPVCM